MRRWHQDKRIAERERDKHVRTHVESNQQSSARRVGRSAYEIDCPCDTQVGRFRKTDAFDCGRPRCRVCHYDKYYAKADPPRRERLADLAMREQLDG